MQAALAFHHEHPETSLRALSERFNVAKSTLGDNLNGTHTSSSTVHNRLLSDVQEQVLVDRINAYADCGTLLAPSHVKELAERLAEHRVNRNWTSSFFKRHKNDISPRYYKIQGLARVKADTPSNRQAFYGLVSTFWAGSSLWVALRSV